MFLTTYYQIDKNNLRIKCGFFITKAIEINKIIRITVSKNPISSAALSLDRIEIVYNKSDCIMISPKNKDGFLKEITGLNPEIKLRLNNLNLR
jgi:hypothetical protein